MAKIVYSKLLGSWFVVIGKHQFPISGRFATKREAKAWLVWRNSGYSHHYLPRSN